MENVLYDTFSSEMVHGNQNLSLQKAVNSETMLTDTYKRVL